MVNGIAYKTPRSAAYKARQGYTDTLRHVVLTRVDNDNKTYEPTEEAYQLPEMGWMLEGDRHTISTLGTLTIRFLRTAEIVNYLSGLVAPHNLRIDVYCYHIFHEGEKYWLWSGVLMELPGGESQYPADKLQLTFVGAPAAWPEGDDVKDSATGTWYRNRHVTDTILPAFLEAAFAVVAGQSNIEAPRVYNESPFWSSIDRPRKKLAVPNATFDDTCRTTALAWHPGDSLLYLGVHDAVGSATQPWLITYDPETREWKRVTPLAYHGAKAELKPPTEWELQHLEYADGAIFGVARTNHPNLLDPQAHYHSLVYSYPGFTKFRRSAPITVTVGTALPAGYRACCLDVSALTFDTPDVSDCAIAYDNNGVWTEVDSAYLNVDGISKIWFATPVAVPATTSSVFRIFWRGTGRRKKNDLNNIFRYHHYCGDKINWTDYFAAFNVVAGEFQSAAAANFARTLNSDASGTPDHTVYAKCRATFTRAGVCIRGDSATGDTAVAYFDTVGNLLWIRYFQGAASLFNSSVAFVTAAGTNYRVKFSASGNTLDLWVSPDGTEITGVPDHSAVTALGNTQLGPGFVAHNALQSYFDDLYKVDRVLVEPVCSLGATESINGIYDGNLFTLHDRGVKVRTRYVQYDNRNPDGDPPAVGGVDYYGDMGMYIAGWPTPRHQVKECGTFSPSDRITAIHISWGAYGTYTVRVGIDSNKSNHPIVGMGVEIWDLTFDYRQYLGKILSIVEGSNYFELTVEQPIRFHYTGPGAAPRTVLYAESISDGDNIFIGEPQELSIEGLYPEGNLPDPTEIYAEQRRRKDTGENFYWPRDIATVNEGEKILVDEVGYTSFSTVRELGEWDTDPTYQKYLAGVPIQFDVRMKGYHAAYSVADGLYVSSPIQSKPHERPGKVGLYYNGNLVKTSEGNYLEDYGDIFLYKDGATVYVAWNELRSDEYGTWYNACCQGRWNGSIVKVEFRDRRGPTWRDYPERYITAYAHHNGHSYFGLRRYDRIWIDLPLRIFWAAPPQAALSPREYDGGYACLGAVRGDKSDVLGANPVMRLRSELTGIPERKEWRAVDVQSGTREVGSGAWGGSYLATGENAGVFTITWFTLLALEPFKLGAGVYDKAVEREVRGQYITLGAGRDERAEIAIL